MSSISSSSDSMTEVAATTIPSTESYDLAPRNGSRQREHGLSPREGWGPTENQIVRNLPRCYKKKNHEALHQQRGFREEQLHQPQRDAQRNFRAEPSILAAQTSTQLISEFRAREHNTYPEKGEFHKIQMEKFAIQDEETIDAQRQLFVQEADEKLSRKEDSHGRLVNYLKDNCRI